MASPRRKVARSRPDAHKLAQRRTLRESASSVYRQAIIDAAERVFERVGFTAAKMTEIGREAGMAAGTIYNYFDSKELLFRSLVELRGEEMLGRLASLVEQPGGARERLVGLVGGLMAYVEQHRAMYGLLLDRGAGPEGSGAGCPGVEQICTRYQAMLEAVLGEGLATGVLRRDVTLTEHATLMSGMLDGVMRSWHAGGGDGPLSSRAATLIDLFMNGLGAR